MEIISNSELETEACGYRLGRTLLPNSVLCFFGDLAAGKTTFIRGIVAGALNNREMRINSPTFVYLNIYEGRIPIYHFDLYRLHNEEEFLSMGFDDFLNAGGICCIEWSERICSVLPKNCIRVVMTHVSENVRNITITP